jgi:hypothetical protein
MKSFLLVGCCIFIGLNAYADQFNYPACADLKAYPACADPAVSTAVSTKPYVWYNKDVQNRPCRPLAIRQAGICNTRPHT